MTVYAEPVAQTYQPPLLTKTFDILVWIEMDRVRMGSRRYTVTMTGEQNAQPTDLAYEIDGQPTTMQAVAEIIADSKRSQGSIDKAA